MLNENEKEIKFRICNSGGRILYFMDMELTDEEQVRMICQLNQWFQIRIRTWKDLWRNFTGL